MSGEGPWCRKHGAVHGLWVQEEKGALLDAELVEEGALVAGKLHADFAVDHREGICRHGEGRKVRGIAGGDEGNLHLHVTRVVQSDGVIR